MTLYSFGEGKTLIGPLTKPYGMFTSMIVCIFIFLLLRVYKGEIYVRGVFYFLRR